MHTADRPAPTPRTPKAIADMVEQLYTAASEITRMQTVKAGYPPFVLYAEAAAMLSDAGRELSAAKAEAERLREALERIANFDNTHSIDEAIEIALAATRKEEGNN